VALLVWVGSLPRFQSHLDFFFFSSEEPGHHLVVDVLSISLESRSNTKKFCCEEAAGSKGK
jgi:hypothetical protein